MKKILIALIVFILIPSLCFAGWVNGYTRKNGTYVSGYYRSDPNNTVTDNYSYKGNTNPYTGKKGTNYYRNDPSSAYYGTSSSRRTLKRRSRGTYSNNSSSLNSSGSFKGNNSKSNAFSWN